MLDQRGSLSIEAGLVLAVFLLVITLFFSYIYGYKVERIAFEEATIFVLEENYEILTLEDFQEELGHDYLEIKEDLVFRAMNQVEEDFDYRKNGFASPLEEVVFITDFGSKYHLPGCRTVKKSLRPVMKKDVPHLEPCGVCH